MQWEYTHFKAYSLQSKSQYIYSAYCSHCSNASIWIADYYANQDVNDIDNIMIFPDTTNIPHPSEDMPDDVKKDYLEAASIYQKSPRGAAALLRLGLQKLCKHLGGKGENINTDINTLAQDDKISKQLIKAADIVRITGNNAVHPGTINDEDFDNIAIKLFDLLNIIVRQGITEPKEVDELFNKMPEGPRQAAESRGKPKA
ncbi:DUF4145 domain-containing protein [Proteus mirabilis]|nr:DUF4145 domain-containing protein [Proteus mirabilis]